MDIDTILAILEARTSPVSSRGDADLNPGMAAVREDLIEAAVLVPLIERNDGLHVLLTRRTAHLRDHAGQVAFPGGRKDTQDADIIETALRETEEEIGISRHQVDVLGTLDFHITRTGYRVTPVVSLINPPVHPVPEPYEVDEVFEVPLDFLLNRSNHQKHSRKIAGISRIFHAMPYKNYYIWGATAGMIVNLVDILNPVGKSGKDKI